MVRWLSLLFGKGRNVVAETAEVFMPNAEAADQRSAEQTKAALEQLSKEFGQPGWFNRLVDGLNRLPRPLIALGVLGLFGSAMFDPVWFAARMQGLALVPEPLWELLFWIVALFFGAREASKFRAGSMAKEAARIVSATPAVLKNVQALEDLREDETEDNPALNDWRQNG